VYERHFGPWSKLPTVFREYADGKPDWKDVLPLLPISSPRQVSRTNSTATANRTPEFHYRHRKLESRPTYGNPIDFRGLRHEPVNEDGVVFLFGMVAKELGYMVEAVQAGFPDCEAKRQIDA